ncbi:Solute carrier organic anion transporter family member 74D [Frankliniella fusca]|uniref:Solute carrier organic anion transporter family member n=1 Tax=Frankliniella fusca TaxID=407009 RepID=A0AAE1L740_9NEOP|nr:Solute carrier organic anion transporter family member 74D [Frankliniella fusca]
MEKDSRLAGAGEEVEPTDGDPAETYCGLLSWRPGCLRGFATSRTFLVVYGLLGTVQAMAYVYFVATLTTIEKRFKISSRTTGIMLSGNEVSQIMLSLTLTYYGGRGRRPLWIAWGVALSAASCFILTLPHFVFGAGSDALALTEEYLQHRHFNFTVSQSERAKLCSWMHPPDPDCPLETETDLSWLPAGLVFLSQFVLGVGTTLYFSLGQTYLDDNTKKTNTPMLLGLTMALRTVGPAVGFVLGFACLSLYIDPSLTPVINQKDPRWLGAWWLGWILLGTTMFMFAGLMALFPKNLPKKKNLNRNIALAAVQEAKSKDEQPLTKGKSFNVEPVPKSLEASTVDLDERPTLTGFWSSLMRLLKNKLLICNIWSGIFYILGGSAYITFITKYLEVQFQQASATASAVTAPISILAMMSGFLVSGFVISKFKPRPLYLLSWNVIVGSTYVLAELSFIFLGCPEVALQGYTQDYRTGRVDMTMPCNSNCGCQNIKYDPVCYEPLGLTFYSACHAGCTSSIVQNDIKMYDNCTCVPNASGLTRDQWRGPGHGSGDPSHHHQYFSVSGQNGYDRRDYNQGGYSQGGFTQGGYNQGGYNQGGYNQGGYNQGGYTPSYPGGGYSQGGSTPGWTPWPQVSAQSVRAGTCELDCKNVFLIFICITTVMHSLGSSGKVGNLLVNYRAVDPRDKSFAQGLSLFLISIFAFIPGPILFGAIIDSTCLVWDESCGRKGNCWLYDKSSFRLYLNSTAAAITTIGVILDAWVCYLGKDLVLYVEDDKSKSQEITPAPEDLTPQQKYTSIAV